MALCGTMLLKPNLTTEMRKRDRKLLLIIGQRRSHKRGRDGPRLFPTTMSNPGYQVHSGTIFIRKTPSNPSTECAREPNGNEIPLSELFDCAHLVSCCLGTPPNHAGGAGGLPIKSDNSQTYGRLSARRLFSDLKTDGLIQIVQSERLTHASAKIHIENGALDDGYLDLLPRAGPGRA